MNGRGVCAQTAGITLGAPESPVEPLGGHWETCEYPPIAPRGLLGLPTGIQSNVVRPVSHAFDCPQPLRGGACTCDPDLRTTSRGFTYDLGQMLGEGWYDDDV